MTRQDAWAALIRNVRADVAEYEQFAALLDQQFAAAARRDSSALQMTSEAIMTQTELLSQRRDRRGVLVRALGGSQSSTSLPDLLDRRKGAPRETLQKAWTDLHHIVRGCQARNARNGRLFVAQFELMRRLIHGEQHVYVRD